MTLDISKIEGTKYEINVRIESARINGTSKVWLLLNEGWEVATKKVKKY